MLRSKSRSKIYQHVHSILYYILLQLSGRLKYVSYEVSRIFLFLFIQQGTIDLFHLIQQQGTIDLFHLIQQQGTIDLFHLILYIVLATTQQCNKSCIFRYNKIV